ncbi:MAG: ATP-binding protein [Cytophagales bacterium]|uniref:ATP-binding protein n=1 Tax=Cyclobacterium marinum TaxID=104 RepID=UPI0011EEBAAE|nr:ATP-binding protein [Cyclobacterium marinum]MBI0399372.1 ATP-binding protein [Cyclobacterium marinum]MBR9774285.1 ATP-binding protein [Cytophagales bacterium]|tara:strand:+ start:33639 stop:34055 length:417 start_codon:yes stop_codon:yes gene_type:complete
MKHELKLYCEKSRLSELRTFITEVLSTTDLNDISQNQLILAVEEVCANLIIHSHDCNPHSFISLKVRLNDDNIVFEIRDSGKAFNLKKYKSPEVNSVVKEKRKGGLGLLLVRKIMDKIEFETNHSINTCRLIKKLNSK